MLDKYLTLKEKTWSDVVDRVCQIVPFTEQLEIQDALDGMLFLPSTPILRCANLASLNMMSCHNIQVGNSIDAIWKAAREAALIFKSGGGGVGIDFSLISAHGTPLKYLWQRSDGPPIATGPTSFMPLFESTSQILGGAMGGKAPGVMATLNAKHADALKFIELKKAGTWNRFNLTVTTDDWSQINENVRDAIAIHAWFHAEPGVAFLDNIAKGNPLHHSHGAMELLNVCAEVPGYPYDSCCLGSINLPQVIRKLGNYKELERVARLLVRLLDRVIERNTYPFRALQEQARKLRRIGCGVMGWADLLEREEIPYASEDAWDLAREIASVYYTALDIASAELAKEYQPYKGGDRRNGTLMAIAPNGHIARLARCSPSIYPKFENYADVLKMTFEQHIQTVMAWQATVDGGVSYTVNLPSDVTSIGSLFDLAHASGVKAISVYRDGSILGQPVRCADGKCGI